MKKLFSPNGAGIIENWYVGRKKNSVVRPNAGKDEENLDHSHAAGKMQNGAATLEIFGVSYKMKYVIIIQLITVHPKERKSMFTQKPVHRCSQQFYL